MTKVYFVRHAQSDRTVRDSRNRPQKIVNFMPFIIWLDFETDTLVGHQVELIIHKEYKN